MIIEMCGTKKAFHTTLTALIRVTSFRLVSMSYSKTSMAMRLLGMFPRLPLSQATQYTNSVGDFDPRGQFPRRGSVPFIIQDEDGQVLYRY